MPVGPRPGSRRRYRWRSRRPSGGGKPATMALCAAARMRDTWLFYYLKRVSGKRVSGAAKRRKAPSGEQEKPRARFRAPGSARHARQAARPCPAGAPRQHATIRIPSRDPHGGLRRIFWREQHVRIVLGGFQGQRLVIGAGERSPETRPFQRAWAPARKALSGRRHENATRAIRSVAAGVGGPEPAPERGRVLSARDPSPAAAGGTISCCIVFLKAWTLFLFWLFEAGVNRPMARPKIKRVDLLTHSRHGPAKPNHDDVETAREPTLLFLGLAYKHGPERNT